MNYDVIIIGAGPGGIFAAYELMKKKPECQALLYLRKAIRLKRENVQLTEIRSRAVSIVSAASIMCGFGGAGAFSDGKYNITNDFGGTCSSISERNRQ